MYRLSVECHRMGYLLKSSPPPRWRGIDILFVFPLGTIQFVWLNWKYTCRNLRWKIIRSGCFLHFLVLQSLTLYAEIFPYSWVNNDIFLFVIYSQLEGGTIVLLGECAAVHNLTRPGAVQSIVPTPQPVGIDTNLVLLCAYLYKSKLQVCPEGPNSI